MAQSTPNRPTDNQFEVPQNTNHGTNNDISILELRDKEPNEE